MALRSSVRPVCQTETETRPYEPSALPVLWEQIAKLLGRQPGILSDSTHGVCIDRVVSGDGHDPLTVGHDNVLALSRNSEANLLKCPNGSEMFDPR